MTLQVSHQQLEVHGLTVQGLVGVLVVQGFGS